MGNGSKKDYIVCDTNIDSIDDSDYEPDTPLPRHSQDNTCNAMGVILLDLCKSTSKRIANGRLGNDNMKGLFTYSCRNRSSVIVYLLLQEKDFHRISDFSANGMNELSGHSPFTFSINCKDIRKEYQRSEFINININIKWNDASQDVFQRRIIEKLPQFNRVSVNVDLNRRVNINKFVDPLFLRHYSTLKTARYRSTTSKPVVWFDMESKELKQKYKLSLGKFNQNRTDENRMEMCDNKSKYKLLVRRK